MTLCVCTLPVDVVVFMHAVKFQFKSTQQVLDHDPKVMVKDPGAKTGKMLPLRLKFHQQAVQRCIHLLCLQGHTQKEKLAVGSSLKKKKSQLPLQWLRKHPQQEDELWMSRYITKNILFTT